MSEVGGSGRPRFERGPVLLVTGAHFVHDVFTAFLAPLLPLIIEKLGLSLVRAGSLIVFTQFPSLFNPLFGSLIDRGPVRRALVILAPGVTGTLMCLMGLAPGYGFLVVLLCTVGLSLAAIHVAGPVVVGQASGHAVGRGMSYFMAGGALARTAGPLVAVQLVATFGLEGMWRVVPVAVASSVVLWWRLRRLPERPPTARPSGLFAVWKEMRLTLWAVLGILVTRALMVGALASFLPTFLYREGESLLHANLALALFELSAAAGAMTLGTVSDRVGRRPVLFCALATSPLLMLAFLFAPGPARWVALAALGFLAPSTAPVLMAIMIEHSKGNAAAANGTYMMISFVARSAVVLAVGALGDGIGLRAAYFWCAGMATLALPFVFLLPRDGRAGDEAGPAGP